MPGITQYFCKHSGEDLWVIENCGHRGIKDRFAFVGGLAIFVGLLSFLSCWYSFQMLFDNGLLAVPVSLFFAWNINNIYEVLLTTLSKPVLRFKYQGVIKHLSLTLRLGFIIFFAVFVSKPLEAWFFEPQLSAKVDELKAREIEKADKEIYARTASAEKKLESAIRKKELLRYPASEIEPLQLELSGIRSENAEAVERVEYVIQKADYFIQRIQILTDGGIFMLSWFFTLLVILIFLLPIYLKSRINLSNQYFKDKKTIYEGIVLRGYHDFKVIHHQIFKEHFEKTVEIQELYSDPPFNTDRKSVNRSFKSQDDFYKHFGL